MNSKISRPLCLNRSVILVTGAYGFVGRHVARAAAYNGAEVYGIGHGSWIRSEWEEWGLSDWHTADISLDNLVVYGGMPDIIIHCASGASVPFSIAHPAKDFQRSVNTSLSVLEYIRLQQPSAFLVMPSSAGVYGSVSKQPIAVDEPLNPVSPYGLHKKFAEELARSYSKNYCLNIAIVRLFSVYGPGLRKQLLWDACNRMSTGNFTFAGTGLETRDWIHVQDAANLLLLAAYQASSNIPIANGGSGEAPTVRQVLVILSEIICNNKLPQFTGQQRLGDPIHYCADIAEALSWGWSPCHHWIAGIAEYANWYQEAVK
jgi:UDP-glucose 4-epimerase